MSYIDEISKYRLFKIRNINDLGKLKFENLNYRDYELLKETAIIYSKTWSFENYLRTEGSQDLKKFKSEISNSTVANSWLKPNVKVEFQIIPGLVDVNGEFYTHPIPIGLLLLRPVNCISESYEVIDEIFHKKIARCHTNLISVLSVYSSGKIENIHLEARVNGIDVSKITEKLSLIINVINLWISSGREINNINTDVLFNHDLHPISYRDILKNINQLKVKIFKKEISQPGRDSNVFYTETELHNLPKDKYLLELLKSTIKVDFHYGHQATYTEEFVNIVLDRESEALPATTGRWIIKDVGNAMALGIKDTLKLGMIKRYSDTEALLNCVS